MTYGRHVCAGEVLVARERPGDSWTKAGKRGGELMYRDWFVDYHDTDEQIVLTARTVAVSTAQKLEPAGAVAPASSGARPATTST